MAAIGAWQPGLHRGFGVYAEPDTPNWFELHTRDYDASVRFYRDVFGWDAHVMSDTARVPLHHARRGRRCAGRDHGRHRASCPRACPPTGRSTSASTDTDAALAQVVELGGSVLMPAEDTPYGRIAQVADPTGAMFRIVAART